MGDKKLTRLMIAALIALLTGSTASSWAQDKAATGDKPANNREIIHEKLKADKKLIVSNYMEWNGPGKSEEDSGRFTTTTKKICRK